MKTPTFLPLSRCWYDECALLSQHNLHSILQSAYTGRFPCFLHKAAHSLYLQRMHSHSSPGSYVLLVVLFICSQSLDCTRQLHYGMQYCVSTRVRHQTA